MEICQLLHNCTNVDVNLCPSCLGGPSGCEPPAPQCWVQGQCQGNLIQTKPVETQEECLDQCKSTKGCKWFTFSNDPEPFCLLFRDCPNLDETCSGCISGEQRCRAEEADGKDTLNTLISAGSHQAEVAALVPDKKLDHFGQARKNSW